MKRKVSCLFWLMLCVVSVLLTFSGLIGAECIPVGNTVNGSLGAGDPEFYNRLVRDGIPSVCDPQKVYQSVLPDGGYYDLYPYHNGCSQDTCVTVTYNSGTCGTEAHISAWSEGFNPTDTGTWPTSYLGDIGLSPSAGTTGSFSFSVPAQSTFNLHVQNISGTFACDYSFTISGAPCAPGGICQDSCVGQLCYYNCFPGNCPASHCNIFLCGASFITNVGQVTYNSALCMGSPPPSSCSVYVPLLGP